MSGLAPRTLFPEYRIALASFPGHHRQTLKSLKQLAFQIDLVLELRDARAPVSTMNPILQHVMPGKPVIALYTKSDLSPLKYSQLEAIHPDGRYAVIDAHSRRSASHVRRMLREYSESQFPRPPLGTRVLISGMPNVGKSSFLNALRGPKHKKAARVGGTPGITRSVSEFVAIDRDNKIYVLDTPGVMVPRAWNAEHMLKLCLVGAVPRRLVDPIILADYLLFRINQVKWNANSWRRGYPGDSTNDVYEVLRRLAPRAQEETAVAANWVDSFIKGATNAPRLLLDEPDVVNIRDAEEKGRLEAERLGIAEMPVDSHIRRRFML